MGVGVRVCSYFLRRTPRFWGADKAPYVANCWRNLARAFHLRLGSEEEWSRGEWPTAAGEVQQTACRMPHAEGCCCSLTTILFVAVYAGQMYAVSPAVIRQHSHLEYKRAYEIVTARG